MPRKKRSQKQHAYHDSKTEPLHLLHIWSIFHATFLCCTVNTMNKLACPKFVEHFSLPPNYFLFGSINSFVINRCLHCTNTIQFTELQMYFGYMLDSFHYMKFVCELLNEFFIEMSSCLRVMEKKKPLDCLSSI